MYVSEKDSEELLSIKGWSNSPELDQGKDRPDSSSSLQSVDSYGLFFLSSIPDFQEGDAREQKI